LQFSRLRLNGFKSFVDPTDLIIADGLTGVVGPNGCGKSNLLEALRWVMGENRPTAMRGGGMEDVIFAGAATRPARNFAEVSISLDNSDRTAPSGFNDSDTLDVFRRITRDAGSAYKTNGKDVRARDVQMLFADASTGSHSPALVRQGQISELINAKPKSRRRILEEAAGISGLYQRRHEAELKLNGAETNLNRVDDVLEQLRSQLATLDRQSRQAKRYREIGNELRRAEGLLLYGRWAEATVALILAQDQLNECTKAAATAQATAAASTTARLKADSVLPSLREEEAVAAAILQRLAVQRDTLDQDAERATQEIKTLQGRIIQLGEDIDRENNLNRDANETIEQLEWEQNALREASEGFGEKLVSSEAEARGASDILKTHELSFDESNEDVARLSARHQSAQRLLDDSQKTLDRNEADGLRAVNLLTEAQSTIARAKTVQTEAQSSFTQATTQAESAEAALIKADEDRGKAQSLEAEARATFSASEGEASALRAEVLALTKLVERDSNENGQVLDQVRVRDGYEAALGAALSDDLKAPEMVDDLSSGWTKLPVYLDGDSLPVGVRPLNEFVVVPEVLSRRMSQIGVIDARLGASFQSDLKPGQRLVSIEGDLWRWDGFVAAAEDAPSATALRLQQINRLVALKKDLEDANARAEGAKQAHGALANALKTADDVDREAREARRQADAYAAETSRALSRSEADFNIARGKLETLKQSVSHYSDETLAARTQLQSAKDTIGKLDNLSDAREQVETLRVAVEAARLTMLTKRSNHDEVRREGEGRTKRSQEVVKELSGWRLRLSSAETRIGELESRRAENEAALENAVKTPDTIATQRQDLDEAIRVAQSRRSASNDNLAEGETTLRTAENTEREAERSAAQAREVRARADAVTDAAKENVHAAEARISEDLETTAENLLETLDIDPAAMPSTERTEADVTRLRRQRESLGAVNLRAEEDATEVREELTNLEVEKNDLDAAINRLRAGISTLNKEGRARLLTAFDDVNKNFTVLFRHLFGGGEANLVLVESDDPLEAGLEIMCQPPGKKLSTLSLLSGGEQTLTALSLIFAVFLANPSPICVLDEVDAPLDDANVTRFCDLLDEMTRQTDTRFLIITHHAVTMSRMDRLYGVTMAEQGVSQLVSVDLTVAERLVA
jgi:chromosome segregation protein